MCATTNTVRYIDLLRKVLRNKHTFDGLCARSFSTSINNVDKNDPPGTGAGSTARKSPRILLDGPNLRDFFKVENLRYQEGLPEEEVVPYLKPIDYHGNSRKVYFDVYGCQMNANDTEIIWSILKSKGFLKTSNKDEADVVLIITCAIRDSAESKIWHKLRELAKMREKRPKTKGHMKIGILGCMAERLKHKVLEREKTVDIIAGPDSYKDLPRLLAVTNNNETAINVMLSLDETYADIMPVRLDENSVTAFV